MPGYGTNFRAPKVDVHQFSMIPRADIPRSSFRMQHQHKTTIQAGYLYPVYIQEILPGDAFNVSMTSFARMATPLFPMMDNLDMESFFFFVPCRLVWTNWARFNGEQDNPADSISFVIPQVVSPASGFTNNSLYDYMGIPGVGQIAGGNTLSVNVLPFRAYNLIWNQWFRDENLQNSLNVPVDNGPDPNTNYAITQVARRHDYFTSCLPWTQKGGVAVALPLTGNATVKTNATDLVTGAGPNPMRMLTTAGGNPGAGHYLGFVAGTTPNLQEGTSTSGGAFLNSTQVYPSNLYADLSTVTATTINALRLAFQTQKLLERDARGGTRYTEIIRSHFGVISPDMRLQRPEYLGGGRTPINITPVPQTSATALTGSTTALGSLSAVGTGVHRSAYRQSFTEHGYVLGLVVVRADQVYQQGLRKLWSRSTRYDFYLPVFQALGEQAVLNKEIYADGSANDALTFGYQERWAEYRYHPSRTSAFFRSTNTTPLDAWHVGIKYAALPVLNASFIADPLAITLERNLALGVSSLNQQFLCDFFFDEKAARPMPMYSVPGYIDHF